MGIEWLTQEGEWSTIFHVYKAPTLLQHYAPVWERECPRASAVGPLGAASNLGRSCHMRRSGARAGPVPFGRGLHDPCDASKIRWLKTTKRYESVTYPFRGLVAGAPTRNESGERLALGRPRGRAGITQTGRGADTKIAEMRIDKLKPSSCNCRGL